MNQLVYYRVYDEDGEVESLQHFDTADSSLGRILVSSIAPPHTIVNLINRLAGAESIDKAHKAAVKLFKDITGQVLIKEDDDPFFLSDRLTGKSESRPMVLIRPLLSTGPASDTVVQAKALYDYVANPDDPNELSFKKGDIFDITSQLGNWWEAEAVDGSTGIIPSNYMQLVP